MSMYTYVYICVHIYVYMIHIFIIICAHFQATSGADSRRGERSSGNHLDEEDKVKVKPYTNLQIINQGLTIYHHKYSYHFYVSLLIMTIVAEQ